MVVVAMANVVADDVKILVPMVVPPSPSAVLAALTVVVMLLEALPAVVSVLSLVVVEGMANVVAENVELLVPVVALPSPSTVLAALAVLVFMLPAPLP